jgi:hypothetical protein
MYHGEQKHHYLNSLCHAHEVVTKWIFHPLRNQLFLTCVCCNVEGDSMLFFPKVSNPNVLCYGQFPSCNQIHVEISIYHTHLSLQIMSFFGQAKWPIEFIARTIFLHLHEVNSNWSLGSTLSKPTTYSLCFAYIKIIIFWNF